MHVVHTLGRLQVIPSKESTEQGVRTFIDSIYILLQKSILGSQCTFSIGTCLWEIQNRVHYSSICHQWNSSGRRICGLIKVNSNTPLLWTFEVLPTNLLIIYFRYFHMLSSYQCLINSVEITRYDNEQSFKQLYCGDLAPWRETCECFKVKVQLSVTWTYGTASNFSLEYYTGIQPNLSKHYRLVDLTEFQTLIRVTGGLVMKVVSPKIYLIYIMMISHGSQHNKHCVNLVAYNGPSVECQVLQLQISSTHQIVISLDNSTCKEAINIHLSKITAPQLSHVGKYIYNTSNAFAILQVIQFINPNGDKGGRVDVQFEYVNIEGLKGLDCEYGGLLLSSPEQPFFTPQQEMSTEMLYCGQFLSDFESPISLLNATSIVYAYLPFAQLSVAISSLETSKSGSLRILPVRNVLKRYETLYIHKEFDGIIIFDDLPQIKMKTLALGTISHGTLGTSFLCGPHDVIQSECLVNILKTKEIRNEWLQITSKCWWMLPPMKIDVSYMDYFRLTSDKKLNILDTLEGPK